MGDQLKKYSVRTDQGTENVYAGSVSFTVSGDAVFETENRTFQVVYARGHWKEIEEVKEAN
jgi:hypothetical protein